VSDEEAIEREEDRRGDASRAVEQGQQLRALQEILDRMSAEQREVFVLFELQAMGGEEIAETLQIPLGTVYSRLRLARGVFKSAVASLNPTRSETLP
jgi:RNA polymerase sigma-70 factor (ECF subfamily)